MINLLRIGNAYFSPDRKEFLIDGESDVANLPTSTTRGSTAQASACCAPGSIAYTPDMALIYMLGNDNEWHLVETGA